MSRLVRCSALPRGGHPDRRLRRAQSGFPPLSIIFCIFGVVTSFVSTFLAYSLTRCGAVRARRRAASWGLTSRQRVLRRAS